MPTQLHVNNVIRSKSWAPTRTLSTSWTFFATPPDPEPSYVSEKDFAPGLKQSST